MSLITYSPVVYEKNVTRQEAESQLLEIASWLASRGSKMDQENRWERIVLFAKWFPKLEPLCRQIARGAAMHPSSSIRAEAAAVLGWLGNRNDYWCLVKLQDDPSDLVRIEAVESLFVAGPRLAVPHYRRILTGDYPEGMDRAALHGLDTLDDEGEYNDIVLEALRNPHLSELGRGTAIDYQIRWFGDYYLSDWLDLFNSHDYYAYMRPIWSLSESPEMIDQLSDQAKAKIISAISQFADKAEADEEYPRWQPKAAREVVANLRQRCRM